MKPVVYTRDAERAPLTSLARAHFFLAVLPSLYANTARSVLLEENALGLRAQALRSLLLRQSACFRRSISTLTISV